LSVLVFTAAKWTRIRACLHASLDPTSYPGREPGYEVALDLSTGWESTRELDCIDSLIILYLFPKRLFKNILFLITSVLTGKI
jgi:hypothetical protein